MKKRILPGKSAMRLLKLGLPLISTVLIMLAIEFQAVAEVKPVTALVTYPDMFGHILASLLLLIIAAMFFDIAEMP